MDKEKQIEEMTNFFFINTPLSGLLCKILAEKCYNAGYRKQEWISVEERLPEPNNECLVAVKIKDPFSKNTIAIDIAERVKVFYLLTNRDDYEWAINTDWEECEITHWMPLPEAPKMKGGAE